MTLFQSTLPREERHCLIVKTSLYSYFNPRSHERSDPVTLFCDYQGGFQSTLPREERPQDAFSLMPLSRFQSTLPREERQLRVSNLTLAKYFNPRSHERSDTSAKLRLLWFGYFNPRSHERSDLGSGPFAKSTHISIHAPTRGAT